MGNRFGLGPAAQRARARRTAPPRLARERKLTSDYVLDTYQPDGTEDCFHCAGSNASERDDGGVVSAVWRFAQDRLQVAQALPTGRWFGGLARAIASAAAQSAPNRG